jgi:hypothetical protein
MRQGQGDEMHSGLVEFEQGLKQGLSLLKNLSGLGIGLSMEIATDNF